MRNAPNSKKRRDSFFNSSIQMVQERVIKTSLREELQQKKLERLQDDRSLMSRQDREKMVLDIVRPSISPMKSHVDKTTKR